LLFLHRELGQSEKALEYLDQDLGIARELGDLEGEAKTLGNMGNPLYSQGNEVRAADVYLARQRFASYHAQMQGKVTYRGPADYLLNSMDGSASPNQSFTSISHAKGRAHTCSFVLVL
jgi:hypothetical protein